jgi:hypothetical protein
MRNNHIVGLLMLLVLVFSSGCARSENFYPMVKGNFWEYETQQGKSVIRVIGTEMVGDKNCTALQVEADFPGIFTGILMKEFYYAAPDGMYMAKRQMTNIGEYVFNPPYKFLPFPVKVGTKWDWKGTITIQTPLASKTLTGSQNFEIQSRENLGYAGKEALPCFKIRWTSQYSDRSKMETYRWYSPGIGLFKEDETSYNARGQAQLSTMTLIDYKLFER